MYTIRESSEHRPTPQGDYGGETRASLTGRLIEAHNRGLYEALQPQPKLRIPDAILDFDWTEIELRVYRALTLTPIFLLCAAVSVLAQSPQQRAADVLRDGPGLSQWRPTFSASAIPDAFIPAPRQVELLDPMWSQQSRELERFNENATKLQLMTSPFVLDHMLYDVRRSTRRSSDGHTTRELSGRSVRRTR